MPESNDLTIRERALDALTDLFRDQSADEYGFTWGMVERAPHGDWMFKKTYSIGVFDQHEYKTDGLMVKNCVLRIALEIGLVCQTGEKPSTKMNAVFGAIQRLVQADPSLGGLIIDVQEVQNDMQIDDANQKQVVGVIYLDMKYRHSVRDPRRVA